MRAASAPSSRRLAFAASLVATLSVGCSALFTDDLAGNEGSVAGAAGNTIAGAAGAKAGTAGGGAGGAKQGGGGGVSGAAGAQPGGIGGTSGGGSNAGGKAGSPGGAAGQAQAGQSGADSGGGQAGASSGAGGTSGASGSTAGGASGTGAGGANAAGSSGAAGSAGTGSGGVGGASGAGGTASNGGASGASGSGGLAGGSGTAGSAGSIGTGCPQLPTGVPSVPPSCGNGIVDPGEDCDVGGGPNQEDGCTETCTISCTNGVRVGNTCYAVSSNTYRGGVVFDTPNAPGVTTGALFAAEWDNDQVCQHLVGPTSHIAVLNRTGEREALLASSAFLAHLSAGLTGSTKNGSAWLGMGYRWLTTSLVTDPSRWFWSEGGMVDSSQWATSYPKVDAGAGGPGMNQPDGCGSVNASLQLENHDCDTDRRPVLCEREPPCAMRAGNGGQWVIGYQGENGHCYARLGQAMTYDNAASACKNLGAHLAAFETFAEAQALPGVTSGLSDVWTAARRNACPKGNVGDAFVWATNGAIVPTGTDDPGLWAPGEPNNFNGQEMCVTLTRSHWLNDDGCSALVRPLCERDY